MYENRELRKSIACKLFVHAEIAVVTRVFSNTISTVVSNGGTFSVDRVFPILFFRFCYKYRVFVWAFVTN